MVRPCYPDGVDITSTDLCNIRMRMKKLRLEMISNGEMKVDRIADKIFDGIEDELNADDAIIYSQKIYTKH